ncbi:MAG: choice-of-anchor D domain-containing protein [Akkermansiaceae bacterium]
MAPSVSLTDITGIGGSFSVPVSSPAEPDVTTPLTISGVTLSGTAAGDVTITSTFPLVVAANGSDQIEFDFVPSNGVGTYNFNLEIASDDLSQASPRVVPVTIQVLPNPALVAPASTNLVNNGTSTNYSIAISNNAADATTALSITSVTATGFDAGDVSNITFPPSLAAGAGGNITFDFAPSAGSGIYNFEFEVVSDDQSAASPRVLLVTIDVRDPVIAVAGTSLDFGTLAANPSPQTLTLSISNTGGSAALTIDEVLTTITGSPEFTITSFPAAIAPGASDNIGITFTPGASVGQFSGTLLLVSNDSAGTQPSVKLSALVVPGGDNVAAIDFGTAISPIAPEFEQFVVTEAASKVVGGVAVAITSRDANLSSATGAQADPLYTDQAGTPFNGAGGNYISVLLTGLTDGTLNLVSFHDYNNINLLPINVLFGEQGGTLDPVATNISRPSTASYSVAVTAGKIYELRILENGNANLAYISGLLLWGDAVPGGTPFGNFVTAAGLDPATTGLPDLDPDFDGVSTGVEWVVGGSPNSPGQPDTTKLPTGTRVTADPDNDSTSSSYLLFSYRLTDAAANDPGTSITVETSGTLSGWATATDGVDGVEIITTPDGFAPGVAKVDVYIPTGPNKLFARMRVTVP